MKKIEFIINNEDIFIVHDKKQTKVGCYGCHVKLPYWITSPEYDIPKSFICKGMLHFVIEEWINISYYKNQLLNNLCCFKRFNHKIIKTSFEAFNHSTIILIFPQTFLHKTNCDMQINYINHLLKTSTIIGIERKMTFDYLVPGAYTVNNFVFLKQDFINQIMNIISTTMHTTPNDLINHVIQPFLNTIPNINDVEQATYLQTEQSF